LLAPVTMATFWERENGSVMATQSSLNISNTWLPEKSHYHPYW
jgi:hypothetical protein